MIQDDVDILKTRVCAAWQQCQKHLHHLEHALALLKKDLPMTAVCIGSQTDEQIQVWDQFILRFTKLQDTLGARFYPALLDFLQETTQNQSMLDKLNRLEQLELLNNASDWALLRAIRNQFSHDYPQDPLITAEYLNQAVASIAIFRQAMQKAALFMNKHKLT